MSTIMPMLFLGHGSPMNAIQKNTFTDFLATAGHSLPRPQAIICISAHWMTKGTWVTHMKQPKTIHDFYGFPQELFSVQYPAPGSPKLAEDIQKIVPEIQFDENQWGLDHGSWSVLKHMYPKADIPVLQLSLNLALAPEIHFQIGQKLAILRQQGVLIMGSGNIVHNLRQISWDENAPAHEWATEFDDWVKSKIIARDFKALFNPTEDSAAGKLSVPTPEHFLPLLYILGGASEEDSINYEFQGIQNSSISMSSIKIG